jgi:hypothetical protein
MVQRLSSFPLREGDEPRGRGAGVRQGAGPGLRQLLLGGRDHGPCGHNMAARGGGSQEPGREAGLGERAELLLYSSNWQLAFSSWKVRDFGQTFSALDACPPECRCWEGKAEKTEGKKLRLCSRKAIEAVKEEFAETWVEYRVLAWVLGELETFSR